MGELTILKKRELLEEAATEVIHAGDVRLIVAGKDLPPTTAALRKSIQVCLAAFSNNRDQRGTEEAFKIHVLLLEGCSVLLATLAYKDLALNNPRNPFPPTPQDVHERMRDIEQATIKQVGDYINGYDVDYPFKNNYAMFAASQYVLERIVESDPENGLAQWHSKYIGGPEMFVEMDGRLWERLPKEIFPADGFGSWKAIEAARRALCAPSGTS